jgi:hypothetical protein
MMRKNCKIILMLLLAIFLFVSNISMAQSGGHTVTMAPNTGYSASGVQRFLMGTLYRDAWCTATTFNVLDLKTFAGGLKVVKVGGGGQQTKIVLFEGADGRRYAFRSVDKDPKAVLPEDYRETVAADILQDQISTSHPVGALVTNRLENELGILHARPHFFVLPDDPALGKAREEFAGMLGMLVERPGDHVRDDVIFAGADEVGNGNVPFNRTQASPKERVHARELLKARLFDMFIGDWDRHRWQWRWAKTGGDPRWKPIPEDRDQAFAGIDGLLPAQAHYFTPQIIGFQEEYPGALNLHFNGREVDRRFLVDLEKSAWDSLALTVQSKLTDAVIEDAVRQLPKEMYEIDGPALERKLKNRRDKLPKQASRFYYLLADKVEIHMTDVDEEVRVTQLESGLVEVLIRERSKNAKPYYRRRFDPAETSEIRLRMHKGHDRGVIKGGKDLPIYVRVIGGPGDDELNFETATKGIKFYDQYGSNRVTGDKKASIKIHSRSYNDWVFTPDNRAMPLDWGHRTIPGGVLGLTSDYGLLLGVGITRINYGFRKDSYAQSFSVAVGYVTQGKFIFKFKGDHHWENSQYNHTLFFQASQLGVVRYYGLGNDTENNGDSDFYKVDRWQTLVIPALERGFGKGEWIMTGPSPVFRQPTKVRFGIGVSYSITREDEETFIGTMPDLYGNGKFGGLGLFLNIDHDTRDISSNPSKGAKLNIYSVVVPEAWDVTSTYEFVDAVGSVYFGKASSAWRPVLAFRLGGKKVWGTFPYFHSAFIGGKETVRGFDKGRFAGDASAYGGSDLRFLLFKPKILSVSHFGLFGFADAGRVWVDGDSPGDLHTGYGGGIWLSFIGLPNTTSIAIAKSDERTAFYLWWGFPL